MLPSDATMAEAIEPFITQQALQQRIAELARDIRRDVPQDDLHLICVLKGAVLFLGDLIRQMNGGVTIDFMALSSYAGTTSSGEVRLIKDREKVSVLAEDDFPVELDRYYHMEITVNGNTLTGSIDGKVVLEATDTTDPLAAGGVGLVVSDGTISTAAVTVSPVAA